MYGHKQLFKRGTMDLKDYLDITGLSHVEFAKLVLVSPVSVSNYICGRRMPEPQIVDRIERATNGKVTLQDLLANWNKKRRKHV